MRDEDKSAADRLLDVVLRSGAHLWHNRPGLDINGVWHPARGHRAADRGRHRDRDATPVKPGLFVPAATALYAQLFDIYDLDPELFARFSSYALLETEWRDLKVACAALLLVQPRAGQPILEDDGTVAFYDDDYRAVGEAMVLHYEQGSKRMLNPKGVLRIAQLLETPEIAELNRAAGFADAAGRKPPLGRWPKAARQWLAHREQNPHLLDGLVKAGMKETIKQLARKSGYKPTTQRFFEVLGWKQAQAGGGHRTVGLRDLDLRKSERFDGLDEAAICERIVAERLTYKEAVGRLPADVGLTPAIMAALLPTLSDRDLRILTPTLEGLGLLVDPEIKERWEAAVRNATDQRALNVAKNVRGRELREQLEESATAAARAAVNEAAGGTPLQVFFLIDTSGSMERAIEQSKEALVRILAGFDPNRLHIAAFDMSGRVLRPKAPTRTAVEHMVGGLKASGGTRYASALFAFQREGVRRDPKAKLIVIAVGDEAGEPGDQLAEAFRTLGYQPDAIGMIVSVNRNFFRGSTVRDASALLGVPFTEVDIDQFADPYQVTRVLTAMLTAPVFAGSGHGWVERILSTPILEKPA